MKMIIVLSGYFGIVITTVATIAGAMELHGRNFESAMAWFLLALASHACTNNAGNLWAAVHNQEAASAKLKTDCATAKANREARGAYDDCLKATKAEREKME